MTEQEAIDELKAIQEKVTTWAGADETIEIAVEALEKQMNDRWIPVTEKLPECEYGCESTEILFQLKESGTIEIGHFGIGGKIREKYFRDYRNTKEGYDASSIIAWRYPPEPYKG